MNITLHHQLHAASHARGVAVVIDVFRAFTVACQAFELGVADYLLAPTSAVAARLACEHPDALLVGKPEIGASVRYHIPNSPTRLLEQPLTGRTIIHRTGAGVPGVLAAAEADEILTGALVNADAIVRYLQRRAPEHVSLLILGHEGSGADLEDELCARLIQARLASEPFDLGSWYAQLRAGPGRYFFTEAQQEYPREDFDRCLALDRFDFVLCAELQGDHAQLHAVAVPPAR
jgi:2-phosphosulfolactate phosphatase